jgi:hypothetical protein
VWWWWPRCSATVGPRSGSAQHSFDSVLSDPSVVAAKILLRPASPLQMSVPPRSRPPLSWQELSRHEWQEQSDGGRRQGRGGWQEHCPRGVPMARIASPSRSSTPTAIGLHPRTAYLPLQLTCQLSVSHRHCRSGIPPPPHSPNCVLAIL